MPITFIHTRLRASALSWITRVANVWTARRRSIAARGANPGIALGRGSASRPSHQSVDGTALASTSSACSVTVRGREPSNVQEGMYR